MNGKYPMALWLPGDLLIDDHEFKLEPNFTPGTYTIYFGLFVGDTRLKVKSGPNDGDNRINGGPAAGAVSARRVASVEARWEGDRWQSRARRRARPAAAALEEPDPMPKRDDRRSHDRFDVEWSVDCVADDTFLYASIANISAMGIFVKTHRALPIGTALVMSFEPPATSRSSSRARSRGSTRSAPTATTPTRAWACAS